MNAKHETGEMAEVLRLAQRVIDLADGDPTTGNLIFGSPLTLAIAMRGVARCCLGIAGWKDDIRSGHHGNGRCAFRGRASRPDLVRIRHRDRVRGAVADDTASRDTAELLAWSEQFGDEVGLDIARIMRAITLLYQNGPQLEAGVALLTQVRGVVARYRPIVDMHIAQEKARLGDLDGAIELGRNVIDHVSTSGGANWTAPATAVLVESLLRRGSETDWREAQAAIDRLAAVPTEPGFVLHDIWLLRLRALLARAHGDAKAYAQLRDRYRGMARTLGFEGHIAWAEAMP